MSFDKIIRASYDEIEIHELRVEADLGAAMSDKIAEAKRGYREAMERSLDYIEGEPDSISFVTYGEPGYGKTFMVDPMDCAWGDLYAEWEEGEDYAHDEDDDDA